MQQSGNHSRIIKLSIFHHQEKLNPTFGRYGKYSFIRNCALLMTAANGDFWTFEQVMSEYRFGLIQYMGFNDKGQVLAYGCGSCEEPPRIDQIYIDKAYEFGKSVYPGK